jgi:hypothetical protein
MPVHAILSPSLIVPPDELGTGTASSTVFLRGDGVWATPAGGGGTSDHSLLTNLTADDHTQYFNTTRGDARYSQLGHLHTGTYQPLAVVLTNTTASFTTAQETKLAGITTGATANSSDATLLSRANHTGTQTASTISDFSEAVDDRVGSLLVAGSNVTLTYNDAANTLTIASTGGGGGGGGATVGTAVVDFGSIPSTEASVVVTGQAGVSLSSTIDAFVQGSTTADNTALDHRFAAISFKLLADDIVAGTGFTIYVTALAGLATGTFNIKWRYQ